MKNTEQGNTVPMKEQTNLFLLIFVADAAKAAIRPNMGKGISY